MPKLELVCTPTSKSAIASTMNNDLITSINSQLSNVIHSFCLFECNTP